MAVHFSSWHCDDALADDLIGIVGIRGYDNIASFIIGKQLQIMKVTVR
jgi:hypothetical protein